MTPCCPLGIWNHLLKTLTDSFFAEFEDNIQFRDGQYEVSLPWKDPHPVLPGNYQLCLKRLQGLLSRLQQDPVTLQDYDSIIQNQIKQGIIQPVEDLDSKGVVKVHYLPHHAVIRQDKETMKLRVVATDHIVLDVTDVAHMARELKPTKRHVVSIVGRFYDPLGFLSPVVICFKILFQELCESRLGWDQLLSWASLSKWQSLISDLERGPSVSIPRCLLEGICQEVKVYALHGFCDASKDAYAAVVYLVMKTATSQVVKFVTSKTRVSPSHKQTIPRLELLLALLLAKLINSITGSLEPLLPLSQPICYTDSKVALYWILGSDKEWKQFVQNRVSEIRKLLPIASWKHCSGRPADLLSRGLTLAELSVNELWHNGPRWLKELELENDNSEVILILEECILQMRAKDQRLVHSLLAVGEQPSIARIMDCKEYSSINRLLEVTAYVLRFVNILKQWMMLFFFIFFLF